MTWSELLDPRNTAVSLDTLRRAAQVPGKRLVLRIGTLKSPQGRACRRPVGTTVRGVAGFLAGMHHGRLNAYVTYALAFLLLMLLLFRVT